MDKPFILEIDEAKAEMVASINDIIQRHQLPFYIVEMIMGNIYTQIQSAAKSELEMAKSQVSESVETDAQEEQQ